MPEAYPKVEQIKGASLGWALALPSNIRIGWKGITETSTLFIPNIDKLLHYKFL
jgi:hypothetical protein